MAAQGITDAEAKAVSTKDTILAQKEDYLQKASDKKIKSETKAKEKFDEIVAKAKAQYDAQVAANNEAYAASVGKINTKCDAEIAAM